MLFLIVSHGIYQLFIFKIFQTKYRQEIFEKIEESIPEEELVLFRFSETDLNKGLVKIEWIEKNEFRFQKKMYDVISKVTKGDSVYLYCLHDEKESFLYVVLEKIFKELNENNSEKSKNLINCLSQFYSKPIETEFNSHLNIDGNFGEYIPSNLLEGEHFLISPPPRT